MDPGSRPGRRWDCLARTLSGVVPANVRGDDETLCPPHPRILRGVNDSRQAVGPRPVPMFASEVSGLEDGSWLMAALAIPVTADGEMMAGCGRMRSIPT